MCGISGILSLNNEKIDQAQLRKINNKLNHRGPDDEGIFCNNEVGLGHKRLSIIDLSQNAKQPMYSYNERFIITYNGEIYNYLEIKKELQKLGHKFKNLSDTEVILAAWSEWGPKCIIKFNGMFAFAIWDTVNKSLYLARDRYGMKPLYYTRINNSFIFASEQKALFEHPDFKKKINKNALIEYFTFQNILSDNSLVKDIKLFPSGNWGVIDKHSSELKFFEYWDYNFQSNNEVKSSKEYEEELNRLLFKAVNNHLVSDVEIGSYLSGGIDSGTITSIAQKSINNINTFTCGFHISDLDSEEHVYNESDKARLISNIIGSNHHEITLKSTSMQECFSKLSYAIEEPRVGQSFPNFYAATLASKHVKVVLAGTGGDELFAGYPWRYPVRNQIQKFDDYLNNSFSQWNRVFTPDESNFVFKPLGDTQKSVNTKKIFLNIINKKKSDSIQIESLVNKSLYFEAKTFLQGLFIIDDKISMSKSLETRYPFMDNELVNFAMNCPLKYKFDFSKKTYQIGNRSSSGKKILRKVMKKHIDNKIVNSEKQGFSAPPSWHMKEEKFINERLISSDSPIYNFIDRKYVHQILDNKKSKNLKNKVWSLLSFDNFIKEFNITS